MWKGWPAFQGWRASLLPRLARVDKFGLAKVGLAKVGGGLAKVGLAKVGLAKVGLSKGWPCQGFWLVCPRLVLPRLDWPRFVAKVGLGIPRKDVRCHARVGRIIDGQCWRAFLAKGQACWPRLAGLASQCVVSTGFLWAPVSLISSVEVPLDLGGKENCSRSTEVVGVIAAVLDLRLELEL